MYFFWESVISKIFATLQPKNIVEIGSDHGDNTKNILDYCKKKNALLHVIDPLPKYDTTEWQKEYGELLVFHKTLSLNALPNIEKMDAVLIDGDHNWYTVFNELKLIEKNAKKHKVNFPLVFLHDIGWPYGRRDLYYNPDNIPEAYRQPYKKKGIVPGQPDLVNEGGLNPHLFNSIYENNFHNGVLTAVEDFLKDTAANIELIKIPTLYGLGILYPGKILEMLPELRQLLESLTLSDSVLSLIDVLEKVKITAEISSQEQNNLHQVLNEKLSDKDQQLQESRESACNLQVALVKQEERFAEQSAAINGLELKLSDKNQQLQESRESASNLQAALAEQEERFAEQSAAINGLELKLSDKNQQLQESRESASKLQAALAEQEERFAEQNAAINGLELKLSDKNQQLQESRESASKLQAALAEQEERFAEQNAAINGLELKLSDKDLQLQKYSRVLKKSQSDICLLARWIDQIESDFQAVLKSWRWKIGDKGIRVLEVLLGRENVRLASDHIAEIISRYNSWKKNHFAERKSLNLIESSSWLNNENEPTIRFKHNKRRSISRGVSIVVLNRNGAQHLDHFFQSFLKFNSFNPVEFIFVDHASVDNSLEILKNYQQKLFLRIFPLNRNDTFSASNNFAVDKAVYDHLLFVNNDIIFTEDIIGKMMQMFADQTIGIVGVKLFYPGKDIGNHGGLQHAGIQFSQDQKYSFYRPQNINSPVAIVDNQINVPAVTAAFMMCKRLDFIQIKGFCEEYVYGYEDVDLCLDFFQTLGKRSVLSDASAIHDESSTQKKDSPEVLRKRRLNNIEVLKKRFGGPLKRKIELDRLEQGGWCAASIVIGFLVTEALPETTAGDYFTALELATALTDKYGYTCRFLSRRKSNENCFDLSGLDVLIVMVDGYDVRKIVNPKPTLIKVAYMRNWFERWAERPWFDSYDIFLCSSEKSVKFIKEKYLKDAYLLRIACNEKKFTPLLDQKKNKSFDYCFTGSYWNAFRDIELFDPSELDYSFAVYGYGWEGHKNFSGYYKGGKPYSQMPEVYRSCKIVLDDANHVTKPWASVNSRVFDAISAGCMVISNGIEGAEEVFGDLLPTYQDNEELRSQLHYYLGDEKAINDRLRELQNIVLGQHTYSHRARELKNILLDFRKNKYRIAIKVPVPNMNEAHEWGDYHFALALQRRFVSKGHPVRIDILSDWYDRSTLEDDVVIVLRGLSKYEPRSNQINTMWNISHPDKVSHDEYEQYDHVFVASLSYAKELEEKLNVPVSALLQCTDPTVFFAENAEKTIQLPVGHSICSARIS